MDNKKLLGALTMLISTSVFSENCFFTLVKDSCWTDYDVKVVIVDASKEDKPITTVEVPKGKSWARQSFSCEPSQKLGYQATFQPHFWEGDAGKIYYSKSYWSLPAEMEDNVAWNLPVCFPAAFAAVPFPPKASGNCQCDFNSIPPIEPQ